MPPRAPRTAGLRETPGLAGFSFSHDWLVNACFVLALAAVLAPLLLLFALRFGLVTALADRLVEHPRNREIIAVGSGRYDGAWFERLGARPEVGFLVPRTRSIAATANLWARDTPDAEPMDVDLVPSAAGDPLLGELPVPEGLDTIVLTARAAERLGVEVGAEVEALVLRTLDGNRERAKRKLRVVAILPELATGRRAALVSLELLTAVESYRDGFAVEAFGADGRPRDQEAERVFASFRLYARSIYDVPELRDLLEAEAVEVKTKASEIETLMALDRNLGTLFWLVATIGGCGYLLSIAASMWAKVERERRSFAILRLLGLSGAAIVAIPMLTALMIGALGLVLALLLYWPAAAAANRLFAETLRAGEVVALLLPQHLAVAALATLAAVALPAAAAGLRAAAIEPAEALREV